MRIIVALITVAFCAPVVFAQVDTLELVEVRAIATPDSITAIYHANVRNDSCEELIVCGPTYVRIYNSQTSDLLWTSPAMVNPKDILTHDDINDDGHLDIAIRDSLNIFFYDIFNSQLIWMSPLLDSTFSCYTIGDRNNDNFADAAIVSKEVFSRRQDYYNFDTVWVEIYDGPAFDRPDTALLLMRNISVGGEGGVAYSYESPRQIATASLSGLSGPNIRLVLFSNTSWYGGDDYGETQVSSGNTYFIDSNSLSSLMADNGSRMSSFIVLEINNTMQLYSITERYEYNRFLDTQWYQRIKTLKGFSADTLISSLPIWDRGDSQWFRDWDGSIFGDVTPHHDGAEVCFGAMGTLRLLSIPYLINIWTISGIDSLNTLFNIYHNSGLFANPQIMYGRLDRLFDTQNGQLSATFINQGITLTDVFDFESDNSDELVSISGNTVRMYHAVRNAVGIAENGLPLAFSLSPAYPNPFNSATTISFSLSAPGDATLEIFDILGRKVQTLQQGYLAAGEYTLTWNAHDSPSGVYFYRLRAGDNTETQRCLLLK
jgi:hypothetical protein